jgi:hypothetical protein
VGEWKAILRDLTKGKMMYQLVNRGGHLVNEPLGLVASTVTYIRKETARDIARRICLLEAKLSERQKDEMQYH